jgi:ABC-2 type transport system ATP-binding protein
MLSIKDLSLKYDNEYILSDISFTVKQREILGLLGPNGAGKSSIIKILAGLVKPRSGSLTLDEESLSFEDLRAKCGYLIDSPSYYPHLSAFNNLKLIERINYTKVDCKKLLGVVGLGDVGKKKVRHFSTGMKQRLSIATAIMRSPELLILDEPFNGLDPNGYQDIINLLKDLNACGTTIIVSSHLLDELEQFATAFVLINKGKIALNISKTNLMKSNRKVTLTFSKDFNASSEALIMEKEGIFISNRVVELTIKPEEIGPIINALVVSGSIPINIETHTILQDTYFELAR